MLRRGAGRGAAGRVVLSDGVTVAWRGAPCCAAVQGRRRGAGVTVWCLLPSRSRRLKRNGHKSEEWRVASLPSTAGGWAIAAIYSVCRRAGCVGSRCQGCSGKSIRHMCLLSLYVIKYLLQRLYLSQISRNPACLYLPDVTRYCHC